MSAAESTGGVQAVYLDTSALGRIMLGEPDADAVLRELDRYSQHVASGLLRVELRRLALREGELAAADQLLGGVALLPLTENTLSAAETVQPAGLGTLDAIHLATALELRGDAILDTMITYDRRLADAAAANGLTALAPA